MLWLIPVAYVTAALIHLWAPRKQADVAAWMAPLLHAVGWGGAWLRGDASLAIGALGWGLLALGVVGLMLLLERSSHEPALVSGSLFLGAAASGLWYLLLGAKGMKIPQGPVALAALFGLFLGCAALLLAGAYAWRIYLLEPVTPEERRAVGRLMLGLRRSQLLAAVFLLLAVFFQALVGWSSTLFQTLSLGFFLAALGGVWLPGTVRSSREDGARVLLASPFVLWVWMESLLVWLFLLAFTFFSI